MPLSRRELKELEKIIAEITTENLQAMVGRDRAKHSREVLAAADRELKRRGAEVVSAPQDNEAVPQSEAIPPERIDDGRQGSVSGGVFLSD